MTDIIVSIIIPIYNVAPYIAECLNSVFAQTYQGEVECLLVDDCGTDESMDIVERMIKEYSGPIACRILRHDHNRGLSAARNTGVRAARGQYICFMDSDDWATPDMLQCLTSAMLTADESVGIVTGFFYHNLKSSKKEANSASGNEYIENPFDGHRPHPYIIQPADFAFSQLTLQIPHEAWGRLIRRDLLLEVPFREGRKVEDRLWVLDAAPVIEQRGIRMLVIPDYIYYYRRREGSICTANAFRLMVEDVRVCQEVLARSTTNPQLYEAERRRYIWILTFLVKAIVIEPRSLHDLFNYYPHLLRITDREARRLLPSDLLPLFRKMKYHGILVWLKHRLP